MFDGKGCFTCRRFILPLQPSQSLQKLETLFKIFIPHSNRVRRDHSSHRSLYVLAQQVNYQVEKKLASRQLGWKNYRPGKTFLPFPSNMDDLGIEAQICLRNTLRRELGELEHSVANWLANRTFFGFKALPTELRIQIYDLYLTDHLMPDENCLADLPHRFPLARVSSSIRHELLGEAYDRYIIPLQIKHTASGVVMLSQTAASFFQAAANKELSQVRRLQLVPAMAVLREAEPPNKSGYQYERGWVIDVRQGRMNTISSREKDNDSRRYHILDKSSQSKGRKLQLVLNGIVREGGKLRSTDFGPILGALSVAMRVRPRPVAYPPQHEPIDAAVLADALHQGGLPYGRPQSVITNVQKEERRRGRYFDQTAP